MVIHDMRNPTASIQNGIQEVISYLDEIRKLELSFNEFEDLNLEYNNQLKLKHEIERANNEDQKSLIRQTKEPLELIQSDIHDLFDNLSILKKKLHIE